MKMFDGLQDRLPEGQRGAARVERITVSRDASMLTAMRRDYVPEGAYTRLVLGGRTVMSDTPMERNTNYEVVRRAHGRVFIAGLGLGMILGPILDKAEVESVIVVEKSADVIELVAPHWQHPKLTIVQCDVFDYTPNGSAPFSTVYFDIWPDRCEDNLAEIANLHRRGWRWLDRSDPQRWMGSWCADELRAMRRADRRRSWY